MRLCPTHETTPEIPRDILLDIKMSVAVPPRRQPVAADAPTDATTVPTYE